MYNVLTSQQSKYLLKSSSDFILAYNEALQKTDDAFNKLAKNNFFPFNDLTSADIDFVLESSSQNPNFFSRAYVASTVNVPKNETSIKKFLIENPSAVIKSNFYKDGKIYYYGRLLTDEFLNSAAKNINAQVAIVTDNSVLQISNQSSNQQYTFLLNKAFKNLAKRNKFEVYAEDSDQADIISTLCTISSNANENQQLSFLIFSTLNEAADLRSSIKYILITVGIAGVFLSLILSSIFTQKIRLQLKLMRDATELTKQGNFKNKIEIKSNDEIGYLASAFNNMLDELDKHNKAMNEYSDFIALINKNPSLKEIADAALNKIIKTCGFAVGAIYSVKENSISLIRSYGIKSKTNSEDFEFFESAIKNKEILELNLEKNSLTVSSGIISLEIKHLLIIPIIFNNEVISILELGALESPSDEVKNYLQKIQEPLAIGLTNAFAFVQLENLVVELKLLNEEYQKQNNQIKQQNESLVKLHDELKEKAGELEIQKQKAEESTKLKSQFLASMSHELRTPMNSVLGLTELILEESDLLSSKIKERMEVVHRSSKRLMSLINDILDLSKIEAGKMEIKNDETILEDIILDVEASIKPLVLKKRLELKIKRKINTNILVNCDRGKVTQVLINLLGNSVKFTEVGFVEFHIDVEQNHKLKFDIVDSGIGISPEDQKVIFEEFRQIDGTTTRKYGGTGLGLSICKKIAEMLNGSLTVESQPSRGSVFTFTIPFTPVVKENNSSFNSKIDIVIRKRKNPVLLFHENNEVITTISEYLESKGYKVVPSMDKLSKEELIVELHPSAVIMDMMDTNKNVWNALREIKGYSFAANIPFLLLSIADGKNTSYGLNVFEYFVNTPTLSELQRVFRKLESYLGKKVEKVLIVDEGESEIFKYKSVFANNGFRFHQIKNPNTLLNKILEIQPDVIISNLLMTGNNAISLYHELKNRKETKQIPLILSIDRTISDEENELLKNYVREITQNSTIHLLDVLKILRDRLRMDELLTIAEDNANDVTQHTEVSIGKQFDETSSNSSTYRGEVLIVDDDPDTLFTITEIVKSCNCKTLTATNGLECLDVLLESKPDLILLDIMMPEMDGFQTIKKIKENYNWRNIPVYAVTARAMLEDRQIILKNGFDDYITKPVNTGVISFKIEKLFSKVKTA